MAKVRGRLITYDVPDASGRVYKPGSIDISGLDEKVTVGFCPEISVGRVLLISDNQVGMDVEIEVEAAFAHLTPAACIRHDRREQNIELLGVSLISRSQVL